MRATSLGVLLATLATGCRESSSKVRSVPDVTLDLQARVTGVCRDNSAISSIAADGGVGCTSFVTDVLTAGGLAESQDAGVVTLSMDTSVIQARVGGNCPLGAIRAIEADGGVSCAVVTGGTTYFAAPDGGLTLDLANRFSVDTGVIQARVGGQCASGAIRAIAADGTVTCAAVSGGTTYSAAPGGGLALDVANRFSIAPRGVVHDMIDDQAVGLSKLNAAGDPADAIRFDSCSSGPTTLPAAVLGRTELSWEATTCSTPISTAFSGNGVCLVTATVELQVDQLSLAPTRGAYAGISWREDFNPPINSRPELQAAFPAARLDTDLRKQMTTASTSLTVRIRTGHNYTFGCYVNISGDFSGQLVRCVLSTLCL